MRLLWLAVAIVVAVACRSSPSPTKTAPLDVQVSVPDPLLERIAVGIPLDVEMRLLSQTVGTCTLSFDLWDEVYRVALSRNDVSIAADATLAFRRCIDMDALQELQATGTARVEAREAAAAAPLHQPPGYPVF